MPHKQNHYSYGELIWDLWCAISIIGIWPRFIEPRLISTTHLPIKIKNLPEQLQGFTILQFSDLHLYSRVPGSFLDKIVHRAKKLKPDLIVFTGDFLCFSKLHDSEGLLKFLKQFHAPYGCYTILGNHDYADFVSVSNEGVYAIKSHQPNTIVSGIKLLFSKPQVNKVFSDNIKTIPLHDELVNILSQTPFKLLHNTTEQIKIKNTQFNLVGLGEYMLQRCIPSQAFADYDERYPGIILTHNPDSIPLLKDQPGDLILCGHTHGGQINLPFFSNKFIVMENPQYKKGLFQVDHKWLYVNRGIGSVLPLRYFCSPELTMITLESDS